MTSIDLSAVEKWGCRDLSGTNVQRRRVIAGLGGMAFGGAFCNSGPAVANSGGSDPVSVGLEGARKGDRDYEIWRQTMIWQRKKASRYPDVIVRPRSAYEVTTALQYAKANYLKVATRCGGHSISSCFLRDGGMLIDVSALDGITVDGERHRVQAGPGVVARWLNGRLRENGLVFPTAHCGMVPLGGFLLGGGLGMNGNAWGTMSAFNIEAAEIVTADGRIRLASERDGEDLLWAIRGGGPGLFGVVTSFHLRAYDLPRMIVGNALSFRFGDIVELADALAAIGPLIDRNVELLGYVSRAPNELTDRLDSADSNLIVTLFANAYVGSVREAEQKVHPLLSHPIAKRALARDINQIRTVDQLYAAEEVGFSQRRWVGDNIFTNRLREVAQVLKRRMPDCPAKDSQAVFLYKGSPKLPDAACSIAGDFYASFYMLWDRPEDDRPNMEYVTSLYRELVNLGVGSNINEMNQEGRPEDIRRCYSESAWSKLSSLRAKWDPEQRFHDFFGRS